MNRHFIPMLLFNQVNAQLISNLCTDALSAEKVQISMSILAIMHLLSLLPCLNSKYAYIFTSNSKITTKYIKYWMKQIQVWDTWKTKGLCCLFLQYYYFIRLMGRQSSHVALECALQSSPNMVCLCLKTVILPLFIDSQLKNLHYWMSCSGHSLWGGCHLKAYPLWYNTKDLWCCWSQGRTRLIILC